MRKIIPLIVVGMFFPCAQAIADEADRAAVALNECMYRIGLHLVGYQIDPVMVSKTVTEVCADQIDSVIGSLIPPKPDGPDPDETVSIDVEG